MVFLHSFSSRVSVLEAFDPLLMGNSFDSDDDHDDPGNYTRLPHPPHPNCSFAPLSYVLQETSPRNAEHPTTRNTIPLTICTAAAPNTRIPCTMPSIASTTHRFRTAPHPLAGTSPLPPDRCHRRHRCRHATLRSRRPQRPGNSRSSPITATQHPHQSIERCWIDENSPTNCTTMCRCAKPTTQS